MLSLKYKILLMTIIPLMLVMSIIGILTVNNTINNERTTLLDRLSTYRTLLESGDISFETSADKIKLESLLNEKVEFSEIISKDYSAIYSSENSAISLITDEEKKEVDEAFKGIETTKITPAKDGKKETFEIITPLIVNGRVVAVLHQGLSNERSNQRIKNYIIYITIFISAGIIVCVTLIFILSNSIILKNIYKFEKATIEVQKGNLDKKIDVNTNDEIGELAEAFNQMTVELKKSSEQLEKYNEDLERNVKQRTAELDQKVQELRRSEKKFQDIALSSGDFIWEIDKDDRYISAEGNVEKILGYTPQEILGKSPIELMNKEDALDAIKKFSEANLKKKMTNTMELWINRKDGRRVCILSNSVVLLDESGNIIGHRGIDKDITERKIYEEERNRWEDELINKDKQMTEINKQIEEANEHLKELDRQKDEFISLAAHELKTPLTSIRGFTQMLLEKDVWGDPENKHYLELINRNTDRLYNLVVDIVDSSRISLGKLKFNIEPLDPYRIFNDIKEDMSLTISKKGLTPEFTIENGLPKIKADYERTMQALHNIMSNSIKFTTQGLISLHIEKDGEYLKFVIIDTGEGIPDENKKMLFSKFYQVDSSMTRKVGGSGLGLSICKGLVEGMGGKVGFESEWKKGSTFYFTLPISHTDEK